MLILNEDCKISNGTTRDCYEHPTNRDLVVKTALAGEQEGESANIMEMQAYQNLMRLHPELSCISHCHDFINTNRGKGLLCECIRNSDGSIAKSIYDIIIYQESPDIQYIEMVISNFCDHLRAQDIFIFDINLKNIVLQLQEDGTYTPYIIDFKSQVDTKEFFPITKYSKYFSRKKLARRTNQLIGRISEYYQRRSELIERDKN